MAITETFKKAVTNNDVRKVRIMMEDSLLVDPTFHEFEQMSQLAKNMTGLYEKHDGQIFEMDKSKWNDDYMNTLMVDVMFNFSHERLDHLKDVVHYLRPVSESKPPKDSHNGLNNANTEHRTKTSRSTPYQQQKERDQRNGDYLGLKFVIGPAVGAGVGAVIASVTEMSPLGMGISVIAGAAAGAGVAYMLYK